MNPIGFSRWQFEKLVEENVSLRKQIAILNSFNRTANIDKELFKLNERVDELINQLRIDQSQNGRDFEKCMEDYRKSKENLLEIGKIQLYDQKFEDIFEQYKAIREEKKNKRVETFKVLCKIKESSQAKSQEVNDIVMRTTTNVREFVQKQEETLNTLDLESLKAITEQEEKLCAGGCAKIKKKASLFDGLKKTLKNRKVKITLSMESDEDISDGPFDKVEDHMEKKFSVVFHNLVKSQKHSTDDDLTLVRRFISNLQLKQRAIVSTERIKGRKSSYIPLKVTFSDEETVNKLVKIPLGEVMFEGLIVRITKCDEQFESRKKF